LWVAGALELVQLYGLLKDLRAKKGQTPSKKMIFANFLFSRFPGPTSMNDSAVLKDRSAIEIRIREALARVEIISFT
jgi:hypothetical protein